MSIVDVVHNAALDPIVPVSSVEPTAAKADDCVFVTESTFLRLSLDGGATFQSFPWSTPKVVFPGTTTDFYGDQSTIWVPQTKRFVWAMLHLPAGAALRQLRLAYTTSGDMRSSQGQVWTWVDIDPSLLGLTTSFDYPQLAVGENFLYVTLHQGSGQNVVGVVILRIALRDLEAMDEHSVGIQYFTSTSSSNFGMVQRCGSRAFWGSHENKDNLLRVYFWDESSNSIQPQDFSIPKWNTTNYQSLTPDGNDWLQFCWGRITGARAGSTELVFGWTAGRDDQHQHPYIYLLQVTHNFSTNQGTLRGIRHIKHREHAWAFPGLGCVPAGGRGGPIAISCAWGGGNKYFANHAVGFVDLPLGPGSVFKNATISISSIGAPRWGDFTTVGNSDVLEAVFVTAGFEVQPSSKFTTGTQSVTHFVAFAPF